MTDGAWTTVSHHKRNRHTMYTTTTHLRPPPTKTTRNPTPKQTTHTPALNNHTITYYFTHFLTNWNYLVLKEVFSRYGQCDDVYIAAKRNKQGKRFGFARFTGIVNPSSSEQKLNTLCIGASNTHHLILDEGFCDFITKYLGGLHILIQFLDPESAKKALTNHSLISLLPWNTSYRITQRVTWIAISGLPPHMWYPEPYTSIAKLWGDILLPKDCSSRQFDRSTGKVCILTTHTNLILETIQVPIGDDDVHTGDGDDVFNGTASNEEEDVNVTNLFVDTTDVHRSYTKVSEETFVKESTSSTLAAKDKNPLSAKAPDTNFGYSQPPTPTSITNPNPLMDPISSPQPIMSTKNKKETICFYEAF
nr:cytochrome P450 [Tanacetum cinerariifolium]